MTIAAIGPARRHRSAGAALLALLLFLGRQGEAASQDARPGTDEASRVDHALIVGDYSEAERLLRALVAALEQNRDSDPLALVRARAPLIEALIGMGRGGDASTLQLAEENLAAAQRLDGVDGLETATSRHRLADVLFQRGEFQRALPLHEAGLAARARRMAPDSVDIADSLERLARSQMRMERLDAARSSLDRARAILESTTGSEPLKLARLLELFAWLDRYSGNYASARSSLERARAIRESVLGAGHTAIDGIELDGDLLMLEGHVAEARRAWSEAIDEVVKRFEPGHPAAAALERRLAFASDAMGDREEAVRHLQRGLDIARGTLAPCNPERVALQDLAATSLMREGRFIEARGEYEEALTACRKCLGDSHSITASVTFNLAELAANMGDLREAERRYSTVIAVWSGIRRDHPFVARALDALAEVVEARGEVRRARTLYERALAIRRQLRSDHPDVAWTLTSLARLTADTGNPALGLQYLRQALEIYERAGASDVPDHVERALALRGEILGRRQDYAGARASFAQALENRERFFGSSHPLAAQARARLAWADWALGASDAALRLSLNAEESGRDHFRFTARYLPERQALAYAVRRPYGLGLALSIVADNPAANAAAVMDSAIRSRSLVLDELAARARRSTTADPAMALLEEQLRLKRQRYANLMLRSMEGDSSSTLTSMLQEAGREKEEAERVLAAQSAAFRSELDRTDVGLDEVRRNLPPGSALVSFIRFDRSVPLTRTIASRGVAGAPQASRTLRTVPSYVAFVIRSDRPDPVVAALGPAETIDRLVTDWRTGIVESHAAPAAQTATAAAGSQLRRRVWDPVAQHLADIRQVFIVPDGTLNLVPFAALPIGQGRYLLEQGPSTHYLAAERDLVMLAQRPGAHGAGLLAVGGPDFSASSASRTIVRIGGSPARRVTSESRGACGSLAAMRFPLLPGSMLEAEAVLALWREGGLDATDPNAGRLLAGHDATESAFKSLGPGRRIVHLATHGFVLGDACAPAVEGLRGVGGLTRVRTASPDTPDTGQTGARSLVPENPLVLAGLALAGANRRQAAAPDDDDGILTAEEVAGMNLSGVEWAVLSACDTGLGEIAAGEGVLGLRRAFQIAGVRTVIMSLWSVEDRATRQWMEALYRARLGDHLDTADAVRQASLTLIRERRARGQSTHPFYWAAFVAAGDWR